jgi:hypothetical protein
LVTRVSSQSRWCTKNILEVFSSAFISYSTIPAIEKDLQTTTMIVSLSNDFNFFTTTRKIMPLLNEGLAFVQQKFPSLVEGQF